MMCQTVEGSAAMSMLLLAMSGSSAMGGSFA